MGWWSGVAALLSVCWGVREVESECLVLLLRRHLGAGCLSFQHRQPALARSWPVWFGPQVGARPGERTDAFADRVEALLLLRPYVDLSCRYKRRKLSCSCILLAMLFLVVIAWGGVVGGQVVDQGALVG